MSKSIKNYLGKDNHSMLKQGVNKLNGSPASSNNGTLSIIPDQTIGMGYSDLTQIGTSTFCVNRDTITLHGKPISVIGFGSSMDFSQTQSDLGVDVSGTMSIGKFSGSLAAQYAKSIQDVGYSMSYSFVYKINLPTRVLEVKKFGPDALNEFGQGAFKEGLDRFQEICGNKFVVQETTGAKLYTTLNIHFASHYDKSKFALNFQGSITDLGSAVLNIGTAAKSHSVSGSIELSAIQEGGNVMRLAEIFGKTDDNSILKCQLKPKDKDPGSANIEECSKVMSDIINYAKQDFAQQIRYNDTGTSDIIGIPTSLGYAYLEYDKIGIDKIHSGITDEVVKIRTALGELDDTMVRKQAYLKTLLHSGHITGMMDYVLSKDGQPNLTPNWVGQWFWQPELVNIEEKAQLDASYLHVNNIINALESQYSGAIQCYKFPEDCAGIKAGIDGVVAKNPIADDTIEFFQSAYVLNANCNGVNYGLRFMLPLGKGTMGKGEKGAYYFEQSEFNLPDPQKANATITKALSNSCGISVSAAEGGGTQASLYINDFDTSCGLFHQVNDATDIVPIYSGDLTRTAKAMDCASYICPVELAQNSVVGILFYETESPV